MYVRAFLIPPSVNKIPDTIAAVPDGVTSPTIAIPFYKLY